MGTTDTARQEGLGETTSALLESAAGYFFDEKFNFTDETEEEFRERIEGFLAKNPMPGGVALASGLVAAGFELELEPVRVTPPEQEPMAVLDTYAFMKNWRSVAGTVIDMGLSGIQKDRVGSHDEQTREFLLGPVAERIDSEVG